MLTGSIGRAEDKCFPYILTISSQALNAVKSSGQLNFRDHHLQQAKDHSSPVSFQVSFAASL